MNGNCAPAENPLSLRDGPAAHDANEHCRAGHLALRERTGAEAIVRIRASLILRRACRKASDKTGKDRASDPVLPEAA
jgi:hypothetical protein